MPREINYGVFLFMNSQFNTIEEIIQDIKLGSMVIVIDDEHRENEGDLLMAASFATKEQINFMAKFGRGLICVPMSGDRLEALGLHPMLNSAPSDLSADADPFKTAWRISVDARQGTTTGISALDRAQTIKVLLDKNTQPQDLVRPGHIFPLASKEGGVLVRAGHTEAAVDLARLAGMYPAGVICEIMNDDGTMARTPELLAFAKTHKLKICTIAALIEYRRRKELLIKRLEETKLPTAFGEFTLVLYQSLIDQSHHLALAMGDFEKDKPTL